jgi:hypothetical protein
MIWLAWRQFRGQAVAAAAVLAVLAIILAVTAPRLAPEYKSAGLSACHANCATSRFWPLQWMETAIYLVLAAGLGWICAWQVRRKRV